MQINRLRSKSDLPDRFAAGVFEGKAVLLRFDRWFRELGSRPVRWSKGEELTGAGVTGEAKAALWTEVGKREFPLTAGKVENLRRCAAALNGLEIPADGVFSFWRQLGRTTKRKGFTEGRELREGCLIPNIGGGLCQVTGLLYQAAIKAGLEVVERHAHSRLVPGSMGEKGLDATVFWNYVDLRFRADFPWRLEVELDAAHLHVRVRSGESGHPEPIPEPLTRKAATGDCLTCEQVECFRHPAAVGAHGPSLGHSAFLLNARWPEFEKWCGRHHQEGDWWFTPLNGKRFRRENYAWKIPDGAKQQLETLKTLWRSFLHRSLPSQGAARQSALLAGEAGLALGYARRISPECRHLVISQSLLPHLQKLGVLGGRTYDVLMERWPLAELQRRLDEAASRFPESSSLADFRADSALIEAEEIALAGAGKLITPHRAIAQHFGHRAWLLEWEMPEVESRKGPVNEHLFLPCSPLGRKGIYELKEVIGERELRVLGRAREDELLDFFQQGTLADLETTRCLVLPAIIEHQPRLALRALAMGVPVIASRECGLGPHELLTEIDGNLGEVIQKLAG